MQQQRIYLILISAISIGMVATAYAANSLTVGNTAAITAAAPNLFMLTGVASTTACSASTGTYADAGLTIGWGSVVAGSTANQYVCLENTGGQHTLAITNNLPAADGTLTATIGGSLATGQIIGHNAFALIKFTWVVDPGATPSTVSFGISVS
jgi:hypothetical protein